MFTFLTNIGGLLLILGVLVFIHEFGHFVAARYFEVHVEVFALGFGRRLFGFQRGGTDYRVCLLPLGGYVKMKGEMGSNKGTGAPDEYPSKTKWQKVVILAAGPLANIVFAFFAFTMVGLIGMQVDYYVDQPVIIGWVAPDSEASEVGLRFGDRILSVDGVVTPDWKTFRLREVLSANQTIVLVVERQGSLLSIQATPRALPPNDMGSLGLYSLRPPIIEHVLSGSPVERAGMQSGDEIIKINGISINHHFDVAIVLQKVGDGPVRIVVLRNERRVELFVVPEVNPEDGRRFIGVMFAVPTKTMRYSLGESVVSAAHTMREQTFLIGEVLGRLVSGTISPKALSGPIEIARYSGAVVRTGSLGLLFMLWGLFSLQLGLLNLLPIPVLDGGHITLLAIQGVLRRDLSQQTQNVLMTIGTILLVTLMAFVLLMDVWKSFL